MRPKKRTWKKLKTALCGRLLNLADAVIDRHICGRSLVQYVPSIDRDEAHGSGGTGSQSTHYLFLARVFSHVPLSPSDVLMDVGCGKGRALAFLIGKKVPCRLLGIEHNADVGAIAADWTKRYAQASIIIGDALQYDYAACTVICLARPFLPKTFLAFIAHLESVLTHPVRLVYWYDQESVWMLKNRPGWEKVMRETVFKIHGFSIASSPQGYSIWKYDPGKGARGGQENEISCG